MGATYTKRGQSYRIAIHANGERRYITVRSKSDAEGLVREIRRQELAGVNVLEAVKSARAATPADVPSSYPSLRDAVESFIEGQVKAGELRENTARSYRSRCRTWLYPTLGDVAVNTVTREQLGAVVRKVREAGKSYGIMRAMLNAVKGTFRHMIETKALPGPSPAADLRWFQGRRKAQENGGNIPFFTPQETGKALEAVKALHPRWYPFVACAFMTGLRFGELAALYRDDLDVERGVLTIARALSGNKVQPTKTGKVRHVKVSPGLVRILRTHIESMTLDGQVKGWSPEQRQWMFPTVFGNPIKYRRLTMEVWKPSLAAAKLTYRRFHATRHTYAASLLTEGADPRFVSAQLGHSKVSMTMDVYGRWIQANAHDHVVSRLDRLVK
jgi:integrase